MSEFPFARMEVGLVHVIFFDCSLGETQGGHKLCQVTGVICTRQDVQWCFAEAAPTIVDVIRRGTHSSPNLGDWCVFGCQLLSCPQDLSNPKLLALANANHIVTEESLRCLLSCKPRRCCFQVLSLKWPVNLECNLRHFCPNTF